MEKNEIYEQLKEIFINMLDIPDIALTPETSAGDVEEWDSLNHVQLVVAMEKKFGIRFTAKEINGWKNVGEMVDCILTK